MSTQHSQAEQEFKKLKGHALISQQLLQLKEQNAYVVVWRMVGEKKHTCPVLISKILASRGEFEIVAVPGHEDDFASILNTQSHVQFFFPQNVMLFRGSLKHLQKDSAQVLFPEFLAQAERRNSLRLTFHEDESLSAQFLVELAGPKIIKQFFSKGLRDLSSGGCSILVTKAESKFFMPGLEIPLFEIFFGGHKCELSAKVTKISEINPQTSQEMYKSWAVSLKFLKIDKATEMMINEHVFNHIKQKAI